MLYIFFRFLYFLSFNAFQDFSCLCFYLTYIYIYISVFSIFIIIFIMINHVILWKYTHLLFCLFFKISHYFWMITWWRLWIIFCIFLIFFQFQSGVAYESVTYIKTRVATAISSWQSKKLRQIWNTCETFVATRVVHWSDPSFQEQQLSKKILRDRRYGERLLIYSRFDRMTI